MPQSNHSFVRLRPRSNSIYPLFNGRRTLRDWEWEVLQQHTREEEDIGSCEGFPHAPSFPETERDVGVGHAWNAILQVSFWSEHFRITSLEVPAKEDVVEIRYDHCILKRRSYKIKDDVVEMVSILPLEWSIHWVLYLLKLYVGRRGLVPWTYELIPNKLLPCKAYWNTFYQRKIARILLVQSSFSAQIGATRKV